MLPWPLIPVSTVLLYKNSQVVVCPTQLHVLSSCVS